MKAQIIQQYDAPHQFEPLLPSPTATAGLLERASDLTRAAHVLGSAAGQGAQQALRDLLRSMNSYYTNRIEGEHTRPSDIDLALQQDYADDADLARRQRLAVAHIHTEARCEAALAQRLAADGDGAARWLYSTEALCWLHRELFQGLSGDDLLLADGSALVPGALRQHGVAVGRHEAPTWSALPAFLERWQSVYAGTRRGEAAIVALAAAHHRLAWMHPFADGNGRVARLHTHLLLQAWGLSRRGSLDGRGNLSQAGLVDWIGYTLDVCIDQVGFMARQLDVASMRTRIQAALAYETAVIKSGVREEALNALHYLFATQAELGRADFKAMTGLGERVATATVGALLARGFVASDSPYGPLRFAVPRHALRFYFPALWPEAEQDEAFVSGAVGLPVAKAKRAERRG